MRKTYKYTRFWQIGETLSVICIAALLLGASFLFESASRNFYIFFGLSVLMVVAALVVACEAMKSKIITSPSGIEWITHGNHFTMSWETTKSLEARGAIRWTLVFSEPLQGIAGTKTFRSTRGGKEIDLTCFIANPSTRNLLHDIRHYAQHLFPAQDESGSVLK